MKKLLTLLFALALSCAAFAAEQGKAKPSDLLKDKSNFSKPELFGDEAVFINPQANMEAVKAYEQNPASYSDKELLPVAICYMTLRQPQKTVELLKKFMAVCPDNTRAMQVYATLSLLEGKTDEAMSFYKKAYDLGDKSVAKSIASALIFMGKMEEIKPYISDLEVYAKDELFPFTILLLYAYRDRDAKDLATAKRLIESIDVNKAMEGAATDYLVTSLNLYLSEKSVWTPEALVIPAKGAVLSGHFGLARDIYSQVLEANPKNTAALRGKAIVEFKLGGVMEAANLVKAAIDAGDKDAVNDAMELALTAKSEQVYNMFKPLFENFDFNLQIRLGMLNFAVKYPDNADIFFMALGGEAGKELLGEAVLKPLISEGLKKYKDDPRAAKINAGSQN